MPTTLIEDRGRDSRIAGTRVAVLDLMFDLLDAGMTEAAIGARFDLTADEVAAARAFILRHPDVMLVGYQEEQSRPDPQNPPEVIARAEMVRASLLSFREWMTERDRERSQARTATGADATAQGRPFPTFKEWTSTREAQAQEGA